MPRKPSVLFMTVGTGVGEDRVKAVSGLAHAMLFSIDNNNPDLIVFFGSEESKHTVKALEDLYLKTMGDPLDYYVFIQVDEIDDFRAYFSAIHTKIMELEKEYKIIIDYTYGTKTMTMSAAMASMVLRKKLIMVGGKRENGIVVPGAETLATQNLYPIYDALYLDKIKEAFNANRFVSALALLDEIVDPEINKDIYSKLIGTYRCFDNANYLEAKNLFDEDLFKEEWPELEDDFFRNNRAINILANPGKASKSYQLASLINNARRRYEEHKYDDAIARLYRSFELIGQMALEEYKLDSSDINIGNLKTRKLDKDYIDKLESKRNDDGKIKLGLIEDFELLSRIEGDEIGEFYAQNSGTIKNIVSFRNKSILAHGMEAKTAEEYEIFRDIVLEASHILIEEIDEYIEDTKFPEFK